MTNKEKLLQLRSDFYTNNSLDYDSISYFTSIEKDLDDLEKYEKALETIQWRLNPAIIIQNGQYYLTIQGGDLIAVLPKEEGKILFELFGGTDYDRN